MKNKIVKNCQAVRKQHDFFEICQTPALACEVTLQPIRRFDLDASIIFSDILVIPQAFGMHVEMRPGPVFADPLQTPDDLKKLEPVGAVDKLRYVGEAIKLTRHKLDGKVPLFGFTGAPVSRQFSSPSNHCHKFNFYFMLIFILYPVDVDGVYDRKR